MLKKRKCGSSFFFYLHAPPSLGFPHLLAVKEYEQNRRFLPINCCLTALANGPVFLYLAFLLSATHTTSLCHHFRQFHQWQKAWPHFCPTMGWKMAASVGDESWGLLQRQTCAVSAPCSLLLATSPCQVKSLLAVGYFLVVLDWKKAMTSRCRKGIVWWKLWEPCFSFLPSNPTENPFY